MTETNLHILRPFEAAEAISIKEAAALPGVTAVTMRSWAATHGLGRVIGGRWFVSHPALLMFLDDDAVALKAYLSGERSNLKVRAYFERAKAGRRNTKK